MGPPAARARPPPGDTLDIVGFFGLEQISVSNDTPSTHGTPWHPWHPWRSLDLPPMDPALAPLVHLGKSSQGRWPSIILTNTNTFRQM